jgi:hypothetical protein
MSSARHTDLGDEMTANERLFKAVAEQVKLPLIHIARHAELAALGGLKDDALKQIEATADRTLKFIDNYLLSAMLLSGQQQLSLEPVSLSSVLSDTAHILEAQAREYGCELKLQIAGRYGPVMANRQGLEAALTNLGMAFIESNKEGSGELILAAHASKGGIVAGMYGSNNITSDSLKRARALHGYSRQPLNSAIAGSSAGIFVADSILGAMAAQLRAARYNKLNGLAATFIPSRQLALV